MDPHLLGTRACWTGGQRSVERPWLVKVVGQGCRRCVGVCFLLSGDVSRWVKVLCCHGVVAAHWIIFSTARAGLGSSWVARRKMYSLCATFGLGRMCTVTDGGCQILYLFGDVSHSSWAVFYATICCSMEPYVKEVGLLWQCRIFSRYWDELLAECHHSFFFGWNLCNLLLLMNLCVWPRLLLGSRTGWWLACCYVSWFEALLQCLEYLGAALVLPKMSQWRAGLESSWVAYVLFSESTAFEFHTMHFVYRNFDLWSFAATCYGTRQLNVDSVGVQAMDHVVVWCSWLLPCLRAPGRGGAWVPGGLRPVFWFCCCFSIMIQT